MNFAAKQRVVLIAVIVLTVWPLVHYFVVQNTDLSPWKGFGWAMYCEPHRVFVIRALSVSDETRLLPTDELLRKDAKFRHIWSLFERGRVALGGAVRPDEIARLLARAYPNDPRIQIVVQRGGINRKTAMFETQLILIYEYDSNGRLLGSRKASSLTELVQEMPGTAAPGAQSLDP